MSAKSPSPIDNIHRAAWNKGSPHEARLPTR